MKQAVGHARADAAEAKIHDARIELARAAHQIDMTAEVCERLERIEAAIRALDRGSQQTGYPADLKDIL